MKDNLSNDNKFYRQASFLKSAPNLQFCPTDKGIEIAFIGRSNAGKSSALNVLTANTKLSRTSKTPGRTRLINFFSLDEQRRLVDLPGYGYAKAPEKMKRMWQQDMAEYLQKRTSLRGLILLMDIRHPLGKIDCLMLEWVKFEIPIHVLLTKADKLKSGATKNAFFQVKKELEKTYPGVSISLFSALKKTGVTELVKVTNKWLLL